MGADQSPSLLGIVTMIGYIAMRQPTSRVITGTIKPSSVLCSCSRAQAADLHLPPHSDALTKTYGLTGTIIDPYAGMMATMDAMGDAYA